MPSREAYRNDPIVRSLWTHFKAVPVLPVCTDLAPLKVLRRDVDGFRIVGDLASTCREGQKKDQLQKIFSKHSSKYFRKIAVELGYSKTMINKEKKAVLSILVQGEGVDAFWKRFRSMEIEVEGCREWKVAGSEKWDELLQEWKPDPENERLGWDRRRGEVELWVVKEVVEAKSIQIRGVGKGDGVGVEGSSPLLAALAVGVKLEKRSEAHYVLRAPSVWKKHLKIAFRGMRYKFNKHGVRLSSEPTKFCSDSAGAETSTSHTESCMEREDAEILDTPLDCIHMAPFVQEDWFATILSAEEEEEEPQEEEEDAEEEEEEEEHVGIED